MKLASYIIPLALTGTASAAMGQNLATEITVDRTVLPEERQASRPSLLPSLLSIETQDVRLTPAEYSQDGTVTPLVTTLPAAQWGAAIAKTPYRGYVSVSYFPTLNLNINAGYRILDTDRLTVGVWTQGIAEAYKYKGVKIERGFATAGAYGSYRVNDYSRVAAEAEYTFSAISHPLNFKEEISRPHNKFYLGRLGWASKPSQLSYDLSVGYQCFNMGIINIKDNPIYSTYNYNYNASLGQSLIDVVGGIGLCHDQQEARWLGLDVDAQWMSTNHGYGNQGQYHVAPYFRWSNDQFAANLGVNLSLGSGDDDPSSRIAPNVRLAYAPQGGLLSAWVSFTGGEKLNQLHDLYMLNPYISPYIAYGRTNIPLDIEVSVSLGRYYGVKAEVYGGYAMARNLYLPVIVRVPQDSDIDLVTSLKAGPQWMSVYGGPTMQNYDVNSWHVGVKLSYAYRSLFEVEASAETADSDLYSATHTVTWIDWNDRAKWVIQAKATVNPIQKLQLRLGYELRTDRSLPLYNTKWSKIDLKNVNNLSFGANYQITDRFTVFADLENLLDKHHLDCASLPNQGVHGLVGLSYKF